jgi:flavodoxin
MNPLIVYHTETGNTTDVAETMAAAMRADLKTADAATAADFQGRPLIGLGSGIYTLGHVPQVLRLVPKLPAGCRVFIFSTSGTAGWMRPSAYWFTHWRLRSALRRRKAAILGEWECPGQVKRGVLAWFGLFRGRPNDADLSSAAQFALQMAEKARDMGS